MFFPVYFDKKTHLFSISYSFFHFKKAILQKLIKRPPKFSPLNSKRKKVTKVGVAYN
jgi:hypothetical protein